MIYPTLQEQETSRQMLDVFGGYDHNLRIADGSFYDMRNMTSDNYPVLSPRVKRGLYKTAASPNGLIAKDNLCYVNGADFVVDKYTVHMGLSTAAEDNPKTLVSMGAYVIILPDRKYINTANLEDFGNIDATFTTYGETTFTLCRVDGEAYGEAEVQPEAPEAPEDLSLWIDTSEATHILKQYSAASSMWVTIATTYIKIYSPNIGAAFSQYDGVTISGVTAVDGLNETMAIWERGDDYIVVVGILDAPASQTGPVTVSRKMPEMDYITEAGNRLWGCRYGEANNGEIVNEIYASKLGDFKNWNVFMGLSTDSWAASCGTDGVFTGAVTHLGYPVFFKENCMHKVYISSVGAHQIQDTACRGVQRGCSRSLAIVNETLFYKARSGVCAYDGALPSEVSSAFGNEAYSDAVAGAHGNKYYISMKDTEGGWNLFVLDTARGLWHREDDHHSEAFCGCRGELYSIESGTGNIITMLGSGSEYEDDVEWMAESGPLYMSMPDMKHISRMNVRMALERGSMAEIFIRYDEDGEWLKLFTVWGTNLRSFNVPVRPRRCDHMRLRIVGKGGGKIYSITKTIEPGSDVT